MNRILKAAVLLVIAATTITAQKQGNVTIRSNEPIKVSITTGEATSGQILNGATPFTTSLPPGEYAVALELPDGTHSSRTLIVKKNCTTRLDVTYKPPTCPTCSPLSFTTPTISTPAEPEPKPEYEFKPQPVPTQFDVCCGCKRDDLKARLDLFAVQLHSDPTVRGRIVANTEEAINYIVNQRRVDRGRLEWRRANTHCVTLWIVP